MEAMTQELEHEQMPIGVYNPSPTSSDSSIETNEKDKIAMDLASANTTKILKELITQAKKTEQHQEEDIFNAKKQRGVVAPELSESIVLLNSIHSFYQRLQNDLSFLSTCSKEDRKLDLEKLEKQVSITLAPNEKHASSLHFILIAIC